METYEIIIVAIVAVVVAVVALFAVAGYSFFKGIFKRKPFSLLGEKKHETEQRILIKEARKKAIEHLETLPVEMLDVTTFDGLTLKGRLYKTSNDNPDKRIVICVHGYTSHGRREYAAYVPFLHSQGLDVLLVDDRAHGDSEGTHTGFSVLDRIDVKYWVEKMKADYEKIYLFGISMGAATVAMVGADMPEIAGVVFDCGFTEPMEVFKATVKRHAPVIFALPVFFFGRIWCKLILGFDFKKVSALEEVKKAKCPFLFIHGTADPTVPKYMSDEMYAACGSDNKVQAIFEGAEHVACYYLETERYENLLKEFFK